MSLPPRFFGLTKSVMPNCLAIFILDSLMSTPTICSAPTIFSPWITLRPMAAEAEHDRAAAVLGLGGKQHRTDPRRHAATDVADLVEGRVGADLGERDLGSTV